MFKKTHETVKYTVKLSLSGLLSRPGPSLSPFDEGVCQPATSDGRTDLNVLASMVLLGGIAPHILQFIKTTIFG